MRATHRPRQNTPRSSEAGATRWPPSVTIERCHVHVQHRAADALAPDGGEPAAHGLHGARRGMRGRREYSRIRRCPPCAASRAARTTGSRRQELAWVKYGRARIPPTPTASPPRRRSRSHQAVRCFRQLLGDVRGVHVGAVGGHHAEVTRDVLEANDEVARADVVELGSIHVSICGGPRSRTPVADRALGHDSARSPRAARCRRAPPEPHAVRRRALEYSRSKRKTLWPSITSGSRSRMIRVVSSKQRRLVSGRRARRAKARRVASATATMRSASRARWELAALARHHLM